jgi:hypothetical protein
MKHINFFIAKRVTNDFSERMPYDDNKIGTLIIASTLIGPTGYSMPTATKSAAAREDRSGQQLGINVFGAVELSVMKSLTNA